MKIRNEVYVAIFVIASIVMVLVGISYLQGSSIISRSYVLSAIYDNVDGLTIGNKIVVNGYKVGQVRELEFDPETQKTKVYFDVFKKVTIPKDSKAILASFDFFGSKCIRLVSGKSESMASDGDVLTGNVEAGMVESVKDELVPVKNKVEKVVDEIGIISVNLRKQLTDSTGKIKSILENVDATTGNMVAITSDVRGTVRRINVLTDSLNGMMNMLKGYDPQMKRILNNTGDLTQSLNTNSQDIRQIVQNARTTTEELKGLVHKINTGEGSLGQLMNDKRLYENLNAAGASLDSLLVDLKKHPKRYVHFSLFGRKNK